MIYRDDDLPQAISLSKLNEIQHLFLEHDKIHTMTILCNNLDSNVDFVNFVNNTENIDLALHGWTHVNYSMMDEVNIREDIEKSLEMMNKCFGVKPTKWYLPWNGWIQDIGFDGVPRVAKIALEYDLEVNHECEHINHFLQGRKSEVVYFHHWDDRDIINLPKLLEIT